MAWKFFDSSGREKLARETESLVGVITSFAGTTAPTGWLLCQGQVVSRSQYPNLDLAIGTTYGAYTDSLGASGTTHLRLPDLRGRTPMGLAMGYGDRTSTSGALTGTGAITGGSSISQSSLGFWQGRESVELSGTQSGLPAHSHSITSGSHNHSISVAEGTSHTHGVGYNIIRVASNPDQLTGPNDNGAIYSSMGSTSVLSSVSPGTSGISIQDKAAETGTAHTNMMPWLAVNFIIKAK